MKRGSESNECRCSRPIKDDGFLCWTCAREMVDQLSRLSWLLDELDVTASRQDRLGSGGARGKGSERPLPFNTRASRLRATIRAGLDWLDSETGGNTSAATIRKRDDAPELADRVSDWVRRAENAVDLPPERRYVGSCGIEGCAEQLFAEAWQPTVVCECGAPHDVEEARRRMLADIPDRLLTASEIARAILWLGPSAVSVKDILKWQDTGRLAQHGTDTRLVLGRERALYRIGDVLQLAEERDLRRRSHKAIA